MTKRPLALLLFSILVSTALASPALAGPICSWPSTQFVQPGQTRSMTATFSRLPFGEIYQAYAFQDVLGGTVTLNNLTVSPSSPFFPSSGTATIQFQVPSSAIPGQATHVNIWLIGFPSDEPVCNGSVLVKVQAPKCYYPAQWMNPGATSWSDHGPISAWWDGANCYVRSIGSNDGNTFVYNNAYYVTRGPNNNCEVGWYDGANCLLGWAPSGKNAFKIGNSFYYQD